MFCFGHHAWSICRIRLSLCAPDSWVLETKPMLDWIFFPSMLCVHDVVWHHMYVWLSVTSDNLLRLAEFRGFVVFCWVQNERQLVSSCIQKQNNCLLRGSIERRQKIVEKIQRTRKSQRPRTFSGSFVLAYSQLNSADISFLSEITLMQICSLCTTRMEVREGISRMSTFILKS